MSERMKKMFENAVLEFSFRVNGSKKQRTRGNMMSRLIKFTVRLKMLQQTDEDVRDGRGI